MDPMSGFNIRLVLHSQYTAVQKMRTPEIAFLALHLWMFENGQI